MSNPHNPLTDTLHESLPSDSDAPAPTLPAPPDPDLPAVRVPRSASLPSPIPTPSTPLFPRPPVAPPRPVVEASPELRAQFASSTTNATPAPLTDSMQAGTAPLPEATFTFEGATADWRVRRFTATEALSALYELSVDLAHDHADEDPDPLLGQRASLTVARRDHARVFAGIVRRVENRGVAHGHRVARVFIVPALWALSQRVDSRIFQELTALEVIRQVLSRAGLYADTLDVRVQATQPTREYCVQYRESDLAFVMRLMEEEGVSFHFDHDDGGERLVLCDHAEAYTPSPSFDGAAAPIAGHEASTHTTETVRHFDWHRELQSTGMTVRDFDFTRPSLDLTHTSRGAGGERPVYEFPGELVLSGYSGRAYAQHNATPQSDARAEALDHRDRRAKGAGSITTLTPGFTFAIAGHSVAALDGRYVVTRVTHRGAAPEELTEATHQDGRSVDRYANDFECAPGDRMPRPERATRRPTVAGVQTAKVVGPGGEEIYTDEHGRIKVQFHWDREGRMDEYSSCWMRVMQPWGGAGWGFVFIPRIGMEVVVHFVEGNPDRPIVLGAVYNGEHATPYPLPEQKTRSTLKTWSTPGGGGYNELRFEDMAGSEEVYLQAQKDFNELVKHDHTTTVQHDQTNSVTANQTESVGGTQTMTVTGDRTKTLHKNEVVTVDEDRTETVHGHETVTVDLTRTLTVTQKDTENFYGDRETTITALDTLTVDGDTVTTVNGNSATTNNGGNKTVTVHGEYNTTADTQFHVTQKGDHLFIKDSVDLLSVGNLKFHNGKTSVEMTAAGVVTVTASDEIKLMCGAASISLKKDGTVAINGAKEVGLGSGPSAVKVEPPGVNVSGPKINAAAVGVHEISGALIKIN